MRVRLLNDGDYAGMESVNFPVELEVECLGIGVAQVPAVELFRIGAYKGFYEETESYNFIIGDECELVDDGNKFTQAQAQEMYSLLKRWSDSVECMGDNYQAGLNEETEEPLKQLEV